MKPNDVVFTQLNHVSTSGMMRVIKVMVIRNNEPVNINWLVARVLEWTYNAKHGGITVSGCGMDMGFHLVYTLSSTLFPDGFTCIGKGCPSNDHTNGDGNFEPHNHSDGGYALNQRWL